jgi:plasmid stability protein
MAQLLVRNISDDLKERLRRRAERNGTSMEAEVRGILIEALSGSDELEEGFGTQFRRYFEGVGMDFELPEFPEDGLEPLDFTR